MNDIKYGSLPPNPSTKGTGRELENALKKRMAFGRIVVALVIIATIFSPTMNVLNRELALAYLIVLLITCLAALNPLTKTDLFLGLLLCVFIVDLNDPTFLLKVLPGLILGYIGIQVGNGKIVIRHILMLVLGVHILLSLAQLTALSDFFYGWATYANASESRSDFSAGFLPQVRPSGVFPAPTYVSFFLILVFILICSANKSYEVVRPLFFASSVIAGSTLGLILLVVANLLARSRREFFRDFSISATFLVFYIYFFPDIFKYNHNLDEFTASVLDRNMGESVLSTRALTFFAASGLFALVFFIVFIEKAKIIRSIDFKVLLVGALGLFGPVLLHDTGGSAMGSLLLGMGTGVIVSAFRPRIRREDMKQSRQCSGSRERGFT